MTDLGTYVEIDGRPAVRFVRTYPHAIERVWESVTTPEGLSHWFPADVEIDLRLGGDVTYQGDPFAQNRFGRVLAYDPPTLLAVSWGPEELRFELEALDGKRCRFTLVDLLGDRDAAARQAAGWDVCLSELEKHLASETAEGPHSPSAKPWRPCYETYLAAGLPSGARIPTEADPTT
jgi:uncharacterized protein YndB with AHSA1/START domain